jgi:hypothetical protein
MESAAEHEIDSAWWARATPEQRLRAIRAASQKYDPAAAERFRERMRQKFATEAADATA